MVQAEGPHAGLLPLLHVLMALTTEGEVFLSEAQRFAGRWAKARAAVGPGVRFCPWFESELRV